MEANVYVPVENRLGSIVRQFFQVNGYLPIHEVILPRGFIEVIFNFTESEVIYCTLAATSTNLPKCFISGYNIHPKHIQYGSNRNIFGVVIQSGAINDLFGIHGSELADKVIDATLIDSTFLSLWHQLAEEPSFQKRIAITTKWLFSKKLEMNQRDLMMNVFLGRRYKDDLTVKEVARHFSYSTRHLSRKINEITGMNTGKILWYHKFIKSVDMIQYSGLSLTDIAYQCHFADQSHFTKTFRTFADINPKEYRQVKTQIPGHYFEDVR